MSETEDRIARVLRACRLGLVEHQPILAGDIAFAGLLQDTGDGGVLTVDAGPANQDPAAIAALAYALLLRAAALADEQNDGELSDACIDAFELIETQLCASHAVRQ